MSISRAAIPVSNPDELQAEASSVERLRRQISELSAAGRTATPQMLAEFARAQKSYLDRKIDFEKTKRMESGIRAMPSAVRTPAAQVKIEPAPASAPKPMTPAEGKETGRAVATRAESIAQDRAPLSNISEADLGSEQKCSRVRILVAIIIAVSGAVVWWLTG